MARPMARWGVALAGGALWWWAVVRLVCVPGAGALEAAVAAGGWGLSLLPVHCEPKEQADGAVDARQWVRAWRAGRVGRRAGSAGPVERA
ncbi:hypothetical protein [Streptomyces nigra]|uniref:hypothetical protein n=1 Tax=Streptomyces nigra TaxID=1827580 RepID=UPI000D5293D4|nr:hypothetical protein [Streptomyces nigra]AWE52797.1 hypothetical protein DC008_25970 [Streptomyces nigra]